MHLSQMDVYFEQQKIMFQYPLVVAKSHVLAFFGGSNENDDYRSELKMLFLKFTQK